MSRSAYGFCQGLCGAVESPECCQQRPLALPLKSGDLHSERCVFQGHALMTAEEQSYESKCQQEKHCHSPILSYHAHSPLTSYERIEYWRITPASGKSSTVFRW